MKQQYEGLDLTAHNRLTGDNKITTENLSSKDNTHLVKQMNENWERILKATKEEFEKTQTIIEHVLEEERKEITLIEGIFVLEKKSFIRKCIVFHIKLLIFISYSSYEFDFSNTNST